MAWKTNPIAIFLTHLFGIVFKGGMHESRAAAARSAGMPEERVMEYPRKMEPFGCLARIQGYCVHPDNRYGSNVKSLFTQTLKIAINLAFVFTKES
ncbi:hypothetical protein MHI43_31865 [Paenibacillus sp. FSL H8-0457]|uniref:hypothetical protein n=1 Tax=Paenibacillus sp. FSL H8-0457 TaxID=2921386 RepID=UPI003100CA83